MPTEKTLATHSAYHRLDEAHRGWHQALNGYHKIDDFRAGVNSTIQSLRNLTFALQKQKSNLTNFDKWYASWQTKMSTDPILKELHSARTVIVHVEDLKMKSTGTARLKGWAVHKILSFSFDPLKDTYEIARGLHENYMRYIPIPSADKGRVIFEFERKWVYEKLPNDELLEALGYAYNFFSELLDDAHREFSLPIKENYKTGDFCDSELSNNRHLKCMIITRQERTLAFSHSDGALYTPTTQIIYRNEASMKEVQQRYGDSWKSEETTSLVDGLFDEEYPFSEMKRFTMVAIACLKRDKFLLPFTAMYTASDKLPIIANHFFENPEQKVVYISKLADDVIKNEAIFVLCINEAWILDHNKQSDIPFHERKHEGEVVIAVILSANKVIEIFLPFERNVLGEIIFSEPTKNEFDAEKNPFFMFQSVIDALKKVEAH